MKPNVIYVGDYFLGQERVSLFADPNSSGGHFTLFANETPKIHPKDTKHGKIVVGFIDCHRWRDAFEILLHEVQEYALTRINARLISDDKDNVDHAAYTFVASHTQFTQAIQWASWFLCASMPDLCNAFKTWHRKQKRK